jgi:hypothetical protein
MTRIGSQMQMRSRSVVDTSLLAVMQLHEGSRKQIILTKSTMKVELVALETTTIAVEWQKEILMESQLVDKPVPTIILHCNNQSVITIVGNGKENSKFSRHVKRRIKLVRHLRNTREIVIEYINTTTNLADPLTKGLPCVVIDEALREIF